MEASSNANFINAVAGGKSVPCPACETANTRDGKFCITCGTRLPEVPAEKAVPAFAPIEDETAATVAPAFKEERPGDSEPESVFAEGLPAWDILPPQKVLRRF